MKRARNSDIMRATTVGLACNVGLAILKAIAGLVSGSSALLCDAVHSSADLFSSLIVIFGIRISTRAPDREHPYGHERFECIAAIILAFSLLITGLFIGLNAIKELKGHNTFESPSAFALIAAAISIITKESLFRYTWFCAQRNDSDSLHADAWHHRSDALCSLGVFIGVAGAKMGLKILDSIAGLIICFFIAIAAFDIFRDAAQKMVDHACSHETEEALRRCIQLEPGVLSIESLRTRQFGSYFCAEAEIQISRHLSLADGCTIAQRVSHMAKARFPNLKCIIVCPKPDAASETQHETH